MEASYEAQTGSVFSIGDGHRVGTDTAADSIAVCLPRTARRGGRRRRRLHRSRHAHVPRGRQRGGRRYRHYARRGGLRVFALRVRRRGAHPGAHQGGQGLRHRRRRHHAETRDGRFLPQAQAHASRDRRSAGRQWTERLGTRGRHSFGPGAGHGGRRHRDGARVRHQVVLRSAPAGHRTGRRFPAG